MRVCVPLGAGGARITYLLTDSRLSKISASPRFCFFDVRGYPESLKRMQATYLCALPGAREISMGVGKRGIMIFVVSCPVLSGADARRSRAQAHFVRAPLRYNWR